MVNFRCPRVCSHLGHLYPRKNFVKTQIIEIFKNENIYGTLITCLLGLFSLQTRSPNMVNWNLDLIHLHQHLRIPWFETIKYKCFSVIQYIVVDIQYFEDKKTCFGRFFMQKYQIGSLLMHQGWAKSIFILIQYLSSFSSQQPWCQINTFYMSLNYWLIFYISNLVFSKFNAFFINTDIRLIGRNHWYVS